MASDGLRDGTRHQNMETWAVETTVRVGLWKKLSKDDKDAMLRSLINDYTGIYPKDVLPDYNMGEQSKRTRASLPGAGTDQCTP